MRQIWPSRLVSACSFSTLRLNLVLTYEIAPDVHGGVYIFFLHPLRYKVVCSNTKYKILVLLLLYCIDTSYACTRIKKNSGVPVTCKADVFRLF